MIGIAVLSCLFLTFAQANEFNPTYEEVRPETIHSKSIINGKAAKVGNYPWFVQGNGCAGVLITPEFILTAAHCRENFEGTIKIGLMCWYDYDNCGQELEYRHAVRFIAHPKDHDILLVQLNQRSEIEPANLDTENLSSTYKKGKKLWTPGFGQTSSSHDGHYHYQEIRHVKISYIPLKKCKRIMGDRVLDSAICTESPIEGVISQACHGDSGSALYDQYNDKVVGIVSWGPKGCTELKPTVYSRINVEIPWIRRKVCNSDDSLPQPSLCKIPTPTPAPSITLLPATNSSLVEKQYFQIESVQTRGDNSTKWCLQPMIHREQYVHMAECNESSNLQWWSSESVGEFRPFTSDNLCLSKVDSKPKVVLVNCKESQMTMFMYNPFDQVMLWFKVGSKFSKSKFKALAWPSPELNAKVSVSELIEDKSRHSQRWAINYI